MKLSQWAKKQGLTYKTAWGLYNKNMIPNARQLPTGTILIDDIIDQNEKDIRQYMVEVISLLKEINEKLG
jgi:hypothetical protein